jgi:hypothetical protein
MPGGEEAEAGRLIAAIGLQASKLSGLPAFKLLDAQAFKHLFFPASKHFLTFYHLLSPAANPFLTEFVHHQFFHIAFAMTGCPMKLRFSR